MKRLLILAMAALLLTACGDTKENNEVEKKPVTSEKVEKPEAEDSAVKEDEESEWDDMKDQDMIVGKSDKDFKELTKSKPGKVRNDSTGKWRKVTISESVDIPEYLLSYEDLYMKDEDQVHYIINFTNNTTTIVNKMTGLIFADVHEYVKKEEHDASTLGSGMLLKSYTIYPDGDIEETQ